jgi:hypothetical protein
MAEVVRVRQLTDAQAQLYGLFTSGSIVVVIRPAGGGRRSCQIVPIGVDTHWRKQHGKPVQEHTLSGLVKRKLLVRRVVDDTIMWRLKE